MIDIHQLSSALDNKEKQAADAALRAQQEEDRKRAELLAEYTEKWSAKIANWFEVANMLSKRGHYFINSYPMEAGCRNLGPNYHYMCTDYIRHMLGFVGSYRFTEVQTYFTEMGIDAGGCCGDWSVRFNANRIWMISGSGTRPATSHDIESVLNGLPAFEEKMNNIVKSIMG